MRVGARKGVLSLPHPCAHVGTGEQKARIELRGSSRRFNVSALWPPTALTNRKPSCMLSPYKRNGKERSVRR